MLTLRYPKMTSSSSFVPFELTNGSSASSSENALDDLKVSELFDLGHKIVMCLESSDPPSDDAERQGKVAKAIKNLEWATIAVSRLDLFSANEEVEEVATTSLKFFLLPAYLGWLTNKKPIQGAAHSDNSGQTARKEIVQMVIVYLEDFLKRLYDYGVFMAPLPSAKLENGPPVSRAPPDLRVMNAEREAKIRRFKESKEREERLEVYERQRKSGTMCEEDERKYWLEMMDKWANQCYDDIKCLFEEMEILNYMAQRGPAVANWVNVDALKKSKNPFAGKPFILTRNELQKKVFGLGYPSLPTMTVEEWYEEQAAQGLLPSPDQSRAQINEAMKQNDPDVRKDQEEREQMEKERKDEEDDDDEMTKKREWDEWKDDHRRGWGNRQNMG